MLLKNVVIKKCDCYAPEKWNSEKKSTIIENKPIATIKIGWIDIVKRVFNFQFDINCREQIKYNWRNWWIMHLHDIGLPPATNNYPIVPVSGNYLNFYNIQLIRR